MEEMKYEIIPLDLSRATELAQLFKAFSDPSRLRILSVLVNAEKNVGEIAALTGLSESAASHTPWRISTSPLYTKWAWNISNTNATDAKIHAAKPGLR
jgi:predicted transcriptional regulator